ncbi:MAG TPA: ABC transporter ATP-binding protein [Rhizobacter sp.]|nr:ABC transporter ATP-binding protein [Rhizobacter sp.]
MKNEILPSKVTIRHLGKVYDGSTTGVAALQDINLSVEHNEFITLVGASGCGKSTLLRILAGLEYATSGEAYCDGKRIDGPGAERAMVFQHYSLYPWLSVLGNIKFSRGLKANRGDITSSDVEAASGRADALLNLIGLDKVADSFPNQLSGGMQQRVAIARALLGRPSMLLMDEPFGALDAQSREVMHDMILHIHRIEKTTIVFVTHDVEEAIYLGQRVVLMEPRPGRIHSIYPVPLPRSRDQDMKHTAPFRELKAEILARIRESSGMATDLELLDKLCAQSSAM